MHGPSPPIIYEETTRNNCKNKSTDKMQMHFFVLNYYLMEVDGGLHASLYVYSIWYPIVLNVILNINLRWFRIHKTNLKCNFFTTIYERVAVGRKYPCSRPLWICLLWLLLQSLFHVQMGWNLKLGQSLYVHPFCLWPDENPLAWSGAIHHQPAWKAWGCESCLTSLI